jgi:hypothetical protein
MIICGRDLNNDLKYAVVDDLLEPPLLGRVKELFDTPPDGYKKSTKHWKNPLCEYKVDGKSYKVNDCLISPIYNDSEVINEYNDILLSHISSESSFQVFDTHMYRWTPGSCIMWHDDPGWDINFTFYVSDWNKNWGGELMLDDNTWIYPKANRLFMAVNIWHKTNLIAPNCPERLTLQTFIKL